MIKKLAILGIFIFGIYLASASFEIEKGFSSVNENYREGDFVKGEIKMNFSNQKNGIFTAKIDGKESPWSIGLFDVFLKSGLELGSDFFCDPMSCNDVYETKGVGGESVDISLTGTKQIFGFKLNSNEAWGPIDEIETFRLNISGGDSSPSCSNQLNIDLFNDGSRDFYNKEHAGEICEEKRKKGGCFESSDTTSETLILENKYYCEKISGIPKAPGYRISAVVRESTSNDEYLDLMLFDIDGKKEEKCSFNALYLEQGVFDEIGCNVNYSSERTFEAWACIKRNSESTGTYEMQYETENVCGGVGPSGISLPSHMTADFEIYVQPLMYAPIEDISFNDHIFEGDLEESVFAYLNETYGRDCSGDTECIVPFSIWGDEGEITVVGGIKYGLEAGYTQSTNEFHELESKGFLMNSNNSILKIDEMGFQVPDKNGDHNFELFFEDTKLLDKTINVDIGFDFSIGPRSLLVGQDTVFTANNNISIASSIWNFGDGSSIVNSDSNQAQHTYVNESEYIIEVTLTNSYGATSTKKFKVLTGDARASANVTLKKYEARISNLKRDIAGLPTWIKDKLSENVDIENLRDETIKIKKEYDLLGDSGTNAQYVKIVNDLLELDVPSSITIRKSGVLPADVGFSYINVGHIEEISDSERDDGKIKSSIIAWMEENYEITVEFDTYSITGNSEERDILTVYKILLEEIGGSHSEAYLIINYPLGLLEFKSSYGQDSLSSNEATYIPIDSGGFDSVEFLIVDSEAPDVEALRIYISPLLDELKGGKDFGGYPDGPRFNWALFIIGTFIVFAGILLIYIILQSWYKRNYETSLFKNPNHLYNMINFIYNSRKAGRADTIIKNSLSKKKWSNEQITYAFNKIDGKRTGMWEIPFFKFLENKKVRAELEKKQGGEIDARFIKRPRL